MLSKMSRNPVHRSPFRALATVIAIAWLALTAAAAGGAAPEDDTSGAPAGPSQIERWKGRFCPPTGCAGAVSSPWGAAVGFAAAVLATGWFARRQDF
jgi:hypothetical protein